LAFGTILLLLQAACGGGGTSAPQAHTAATSTVAQVAQMRVQSEPPGAHCSGGGFRFDLGPDGNYDGQLETAEAQASAYACPAADTDVVLASMSAGTTECTTGAVVLRAGVDANRDGVLQEAEVGDRAVICLADPAAITPRLARLSVAASSATCPFGGTALVFGTDLNRDGMLEGDEGSSSATLCREYAATPLVWADTSSTGGAAVQATPNTAYRAVDDSQPTVVTLPQNPAVGDVVAVSGAGSAGWRIAQNAGQSINAQSLGLVAGQTWIAREQGRPWLSIKSSADGRRLFASTWLGQLYTSDDAGLTWKPRDAARGWGYGTSSPDGLQLSVSADDGFVHFSTDGGEAWTAVAGPGGSAPGSYYLLASSSGGERLALTGYGQPIQISTDGGAHWQPGPIRGWYDLAMTPDGASLWAAANGGGGTAEYLYASYDGGASWTPKSPSSTGWTTVSVSADGKTVLGGQYPGLLYLSVDGGASWSATSAPSAQWWSTAVSIDGKTLLGAASGGPLYASHDGGQTWLTNSPQADWAYVTVSADGTRMAAVAWNGQIYTSSTWTTVGPTGGLSGGAADGVLLQYTGNGNFVVVQHTGTVTVQ
jgi:hypothetical protein